MNWKKLSFDFFLLFLSFFLSEQQQLKVRNEDNNQDNDDDDNENGDNDDDDDDDNDDDDDGRSFPVQRLSKFNSFRDFKRERRKNVENFWSGNDDEDPMSHQIMTNMLPLFDGACQARQKPFQGAITEIN